MVGDHPTRQFRTYRCPRSVNGPVRPKPSAGARPPRRHVPAAAARRLRHGGGNMTITPSKWLLASKLLGRDVPTSEPYPCLRKEIGYRNCACDGCNPRPVTPPAGGGLSDEEFAKLLASVAPAKSGNPAQAPAKHEDEDLADTVRRICRAYSDSFARTQQKQIGLSEIGDPCDRAVAYRLFELPAVNTERDRHLADVGTAWHAWLAEAFAMENRRLGRERYLIE